MHIYIYNIYIHIYIYIYIYIYIGLVARVFADGLRYQGSIPIQFTPNFQEIVKETSLLNTLYYKVGIKGNVGNPRKGVVPSYTHSSPSITVANINFP